MEKRRRILLTSSAVILICLSVAIGATLALFSDSTTVKTHLTAGDLEADLWRTNLEYSSLDEEGMLVKTNVYQDLDMSNTTLTEANAFGLDTEEIRIIPGSFIKADMEIRNTGNVAFNYTVKLIFSGDNTKSKDAFAKQLMITITDTSGNKSEPMALDKFTLEGEDYVVLQGLIKVSTVENVIAKDSFSIKVEFVDDDDNNLAQAATASFDLIVEAVQASK